MSTRRTVSSALVAPIQLLNSVAVHGVSALRPYAPQFIPILVCLFFIPLAVGLSLFAGWMVWRSLAVGWETPIYLQYGESIVPYAYTLLPSLKSAQPYDIFVHLTLPVSESNLSLGNFMTTLTLLTPSNTTLATISRPAIAIPPKYSWFLMKSNTINIDVLMLKSFVASTSKVMAYIELGRKDAWKNIGTGQGREVSVLTASIRGTAIPRGIRGLAMRFPLTAAFLSSCTFLVILALAIGSCVLPTMFPIPTDDTKSPPTDDTKPLPILKTHRAKSEPLHDFEYPLPHTRSNSSASEGRTITRRRRSTLIRRRASTSRVDDGHLQVKTEPIEMITPSARAGDVDDAPGTSAHAFGSGREELRRRTSDRFDKSEEVSDEGM